MKKIIFLVIGGIFLSLIIISINPGVFFLILFGGLAFFWWEKRVRKKRAEFEKTKKEKKFKETKLRDSSTRIKNGFSPIFFYLTPSKTPPSRMGTGRLSPEEQEKIREFRKEGWELKKIQMETGIGTGTIIKYTKDINPPFLYYERRLIGGIFEGSIIDLETTGLEPHKSEIITFGYIVKNILKVIQRREATEYRFLEKMKQELSNLPYPIYAFNAEFESKFLKHKLGQEISLIDIRAPLAERANKLGLDFPSLDKLASVPREYFGEKPMYGRDAPKSWEIYLKTGQNSFLVPIVHHNIEDLLRALYILMHYKAEIL